MTNPILFLILIISLILSGYFILRYLSGDYDYTDEVIGCGNILDMNNNIRGKYFDIARTYASGRIKMRREKVFTN